MSQDVPTALIDESAAAVSDERRFAVPHALKLRGICSAEGVAESSGLELSEVGSTLSQLAESRQVRQRDGRVAGFMLLGSGAGEHAELLDRFVSGADELATLNRAYEAFLR